MLLLCFQFLLPLLLISIVRFIEGIKIIDWPSVSLGKMPEPLLILGGSWGLAGTVFGGRFPCTSDISLAEDALIIFPSQSDVAQHSVSLADLCKNLRCLHAARVLVRMVDKRLFVVGCFDLRLCCTWRYFKDVVIGLSPIERWSILGFAFSSPGVVSGAGQLTITMLQSGKPLCL